MPRSRPDGGKLVVHCHNQVKDGVDLGMEAVITRGGNTVGSDIKDRLPMPDHDRVDSSISSSDVGNYTGLVDLIGLFNDSVLKREPGIRRLLQYHMNLAHAVVRTANLSNSKVDDGRSHVQQYWHPNDALDRKCHCHTRTRET